MLKVILISITLAILGGMSTSYLISKYHAKSIVEEHARELESTDFERRKKLCNELGSASPEQPNIAIEMIRERIQEINYREETRWQK